MCWVGAKRNGCGDTLDWCKTQWLWRDVGLVEDAMVVAGRWVGARRNGCGGTLGWCKA